jgi:hypothetical protein
LGRVFWLPTFDIPKHLSAETRSMIETALEDALQGAGETDLKKLKWSAIHAWPGSLQAEQAMTAKRSRVSRTAA